MFLYLSLASADAVITSLYFLLTNHAQGLYQHNYLDRQFFYLIFALCWHLILYTLYLSFSSFALVLLAVPWVNNRLLSYFQIPKYTERCLIKVVSILLKYELKHITQNIFHQKIKIQTRAFQEVLRSENIYLLCENLVKLYLILHIQKNYPKYYYQALHYFFGAGLTLEQEKLWEIIQDADWVKLTQRNILYTIMKLYQGQQSTELFLIGFRMMSLYTLMNLFSTELAILVSFGYLGIECYRRFKIIQKWTHRILWIQLMYLGEIGVILYLPLYGSIIQIGGLYSQLKDPQLLYPVIYIWLVGFFSDYHPVHLFFNLQVVLTVVLSQEKQPPSIQIIEDYQR